MNAKKISLSETIDNYVLQLKQLDFEPCPDSFKLAFMNHLEAWDKMTEVTDQYKELRGEMHVLFDSIAAGSDSMHFKPRLKAIWDTWGDVEKWKKE